MSSAGKVLYIEDDIGSQRLVQRVLEGVGYDVLIACDGMAGIDLARRAEPDLILMDINIPGMNGREITTRLRSMPHFNKTPIVALTANTSPGHRERALAAGCDGFLTKPIDVASFPREVENYLEGHREQLATDERLEHLEQHAQQMVTHLEDKIHELEQANRRLRELDRMKSDFIALVSHELRTPLTLLEGYAHLLQDQVQSEPDAPYPPGLLELVRGLDVGVSRISQVINEIINVSRIASGRLELALGPVRLADLVEEAALVYEQVLNDRDLRLVLDSRLQEMPIIQADGRQLEVAIGNVIGNAIKYTPNGGAITVSARRVNGAVDLTIQDTGIGIPVREQRRIFDHFYLLESIEHHSTSKSAFQGGGLGLGLAICRGIVEAHQGRVWVDSPGRDPRQLPGSTFHLLLPLDPADARK